MHSQLLCLDTVEDIVNRIDHYNQYTTMDTSSIACAVDIFATMAQLEDLLAANSLCIRYHGNENFESVTSVQTEWLSGSKVVITLQVVQKKSKSAVLYLFFLQGKKESKAIRVSLPKKSHNPNQPSRRWATLYTGVLPVCMPVLDYVTAPTEIRLTLDCLQWKLAM